MVNEFVVGVQDKFPKEILNGSTMIEGNVCACLLQNLTYFDDTPLEPSSFLTRDGRFLYSLGFEKESRFDKNKKEYWLFERSQDLQKSLDFFFSMRKKQKRNNN